MQNHESNTVSVKGILEKIIYTSEKTNFTVAKLKTEEDPFSVIIVGTIMATNEGEKVKVKGTWQKHPKYGKQIQIESFEVILPTHTEGVLKYLNSGGIKGIGPSLAKRIVNIFGKDFFKFWIKIQKNY